LRPELEEVQDKAEFFVCYEFEGIEPDEAMRPKFIDLLQRLFVNTFLRRDLADERDIWLSVSRPDSEFHPDGPRPLWLNLEVLGLAFLTQNFDRFTFSQLAWLCCMPSIIDDVSWDAFFDADDWDIKWAVELSREERRLDDRFNLVEGKISRLGLGGHWA